MFSIFFLVKSIYFDCDFTISYIHSIKSFDFGCDFTIVDLALLFRPEAKSRF